MASTDIEITDSLSETHDFVGKMISDRRKTKKPLMEKLRRDRINNSLNEMKVLVLDSLNKDVSRYSKMEKADILEMTVKFLKEVNRQERATKAVSSWAEYRTGYNRCALELMQNINTTGSPQGGVQGQFYSPLGTAGCNGSTSVTSHRTGTLILANTSPTIPTSSVGMATGKIPTVVWVPLPSPPPSPSNKILPCPASAPFISTAIETKKEELEFQKTASHLFPSTKISTSPSLVVAAPTMWRPW